MLWGRDAERHAITELIDGVRDGRGAALVLRGEAGIGRTALLDDAAARADEAVRVLRLHGTPAEIELAFAGLHRLLAPLRSEVDALPRNRAEALRAALDGDGPTTDLRVCAALYELLTAMAARTPLLVIVDDAESLDRASLATLLFCARRAEPAGFGILLAVRDPDRHRIDAHDLPQLVLTGLGTKDAVRLIAGAPLDAGTRDLVLRAARGNPLALRQLAAADRRRLAEGGLLTGSGPVDEVLRRLLRDRVDAADGRQRPALLLAAADDTGRPEVVEAAAERLGVPHVRVENDHPLAKAVAYDAASPKERRAVHRALADALAAEPVRALRHRALAAAGPDEALAAALEREARATTGSGGMAATVSVLLHAARLSWQPADRARRTALAAHAAWKTGYGTLARELVAASPDAPVGLIRLRGLIDLYGGHQPTAYGTLVENAETLRGLGHEDEAAELSFMAVDAALHSDLPAEAVAAAERVAASHPDPAYRGYGRLLAAAVAGRPDPASASPWRVLADAPAAIARSGAHRWLIPLAICRESTNPRAAREFALSAVESMRATGMIAVCTVPTLWLAELEHRLGLWDEAIGHATEGLALARDAGQPVAEADLSALLALLHADRGDLAEAGAYAEQAAALASRYGNRLAAAKAMWARGRIAALRGDADEAAELLAGVRRAHAAVGAEAGMDLAEAVARTEGAGAPLIGDGPAWAVGSTAAEPIGTALSEVESPDRPYETARLALAYGRRLRRDRRPKDARAPLRLAARIFDGLGARPWAEAARGELRACGAGAPRPEASPLTPQELAVASLAARGLSNREIGARMYLSPRTVGYHLAKVFTKVGVSARAQLRDLELAAV